MKKLLVWALATLIVIPSLVSCSNEKIDEPQAGLAGYLNTVVLTDDQNKVLDTALNNLASWLPEDAEVIFEGIRDIPTKGYSYEAAFVLPVGFGESLELAKQYEMQEYGTGSPTGCFYAGETFSPDMGASSVPKLNGTAPEDTGASWKFLLESGGMICSYEFPGTEFIAGTVPLQYSSQYGKNVDLDTSYWPAEKEWFLYVRTVLTPYEKT
jgi:hypothetical protein